MRGRQALAPGGSTNRRLRSVRGLPRVVWVLAAGSFINRFGGFVLVFLVLYVRQLGYSPVEAGLAASAYAAGKLVAGPTGGELTDRLGPRACIAVSMFGSAAAMLMLSQLRWLPGLFTLACLSGLLGELYRPSTSKLIADAVGGSQRITAFGVYQTGVSAGMAAGPAIAGLLAERSYQWLFVGDAATSALWGLMALVMLPTPRPSSALAEDQPAAAATASRTRRRAARLLVATVLVNLALFQSQSTFPLWVTSHGHPPVIYGSLLSASAVLTVALQLPLGSLVRRFHPPLAIAASSAVVGAGFGLLGFGAGLVVLVAATLVWTLGELIQWPVAASYLTDLAPPRQLGRYAGLRSLAYGTAMLIAPAAGTAIYHHHPQLIWWLSLTAALAAGTALLPDLRRPTTPAMPNAGTTLPRHQPPRPTRRGPATTGGTHAPLGLAGLVTLALPPRGGLHQPSQTQPSTPTRPTTEGVSHDNRTTVPQQRGVAPGRSPDARPRMGRQGATA